MADEKKRITDLPDEISIDETDLLLVGSNGTSALRKTTLAKIKEWILGTTPDVDRFYPIGSIYMTTENTNPKDLFGGGTWELLKDRFLIGAGGGYAVDAVGGATTVKLAVGNLPSHNHSGPSHSHTISIGDSLALRTSSDGSHQHYAKYSKDAASGSAKGRYYPGGSSQIDSPFTLAAGAHTHTIPQHNHGASCGNAGTGNTGSTGSGDAFSIMPPYLAVYIWRRVS